tara:strand:- start:929 stop:1096 length:168 start_codon:yes stop_codon:yes gene_type:complete
VTPERFSETLKRLFKLGREYENSTDGNHHDEARMAKEQYEYLKVLLEEEYEEVTA